MREVDKKKTQNNQRKNHHPTPTRQRDKNKPATDNSGRTHTRKETNKPRNAASKGGNNTNKLKPATAAKSVADTDKPKAADPPVVHQDLVVKDDDVSKSEDTAQDTGNEKDGKVVNASYGKTSTELEKDNNSDSDSETADDDDDDDDETASSMDADSQLAADAEEESLSKLAVEHKQHSNGSDVAGSFPASNASSINAANDSTPCLEDDSVNTDIALPESSSQGRLSYNNDNLITERGNEDEEAFDEVSLDDRSTEVCNTDVNLEDRAAAVDDDEKIIERQLEEKIEKLEDELIEVAALETSLYSIVPDHDGSSAHKLHTPARQLSSLYIHASKHWTQSKRASIARSIVSGLVLVARTCGSDVSRLTYWLSNTVVLREMISQAFGNSRQMMNSVKLAELTGGKSCFSSAGKQVMKKNGLNQLVQDWQEARTFTAALETIESWIFLRVVDSIWWQIFAPNMQCPDEDSTTRPPSPNSEDQGGSFSTDLWKNAFQDAYRRLCPVRSAGNECGCLSVLARMVMEQSVGRLDVAMFNAILRESANQIPTDPVSDPILDPSVLPIPAGDLSFGSGAQLKNAVGNWSRWLSDTLAMETGYHSTENNRNASEDEDENQKTPSHTPPQKCFRLLDELSDLLMLPKDMLLDRSVRKEVCPSITLPLIKRVLCNFSPDEFCPDDVPGEVLEELNAESVMERRLSSTDPNSSRSFPYTANPIVYSLPSSADLAEKVAQVGGNHQLGRVLSKDYTCDEELNDLSSPLASIIMTADQSQNANGETSYGLNLRYKLLQEVWSVL